MNDIINVYTNITQFSARLDNVARKQLPYATARALSQLASEVASAEQLNEDKRLDRPRPFTKNAIRAIPARKELPIAKVVMMDRTAGYLFPYEFGGLNVLNSKVLLKPIESKKDLDQFGNLPRNFTSKLKGRKDVFVGTVKTKIGPVTGIWQRSSVKDPNDAAAVAKARVAVAHVNKKTGRVTVRKTAKSINTTGKLKLLIKFSPAHPIDPKNHLAWFDVAEKLVSKRFNPVMGAHLGRAIAAAKP